LSSVEAISYARPPACARDSLRVRLAGLDVPARERGASPEHRQGLVPAWRGWPRRVAANARVAVASASA
jgi:hypothetical protein